MTPSLCFFLGAIVYFCSATPQYFVYDASNRSYVPKTLDLPPTALSMSPTFATDPPTEKFGWQSQAGQDAILLKFFNDKNSGYFVDLAANHYKEGSNTYVVDYFNHWNGICVEPNPMYLVGLLSNRRCMVISAVVSKAEGESVTFRFREGLGGMVGKDFDNDGGHISDKDVTMLTTTFTSILDFAKAPSVMDYLSLDVEGAEHYVLAGLDHAKYKFMMVTIERPKHHSHHILSKAGYRFVYQMAKWGECIYLHQSKPDFATLMVQYRQVTTPEWNWESKPYLMHPAWNESYTEELKFEFGVR